MNRSRHVISAVVLLGMGVFATWNAVHNGNWTDPVLPVVGGLALIWWAGGLGLLSRTSVGVWLGRLGATALLVVGVYLGWDNVVHPTGSTLYGDPLLIVLPLTALWVGAGIGVLVTLRPRADRDPTGRQLPQLCAAIAVGAAGSLAAASGLGISGWPAAIAILSGAGLIAATLRPDRIGFLGAWLGALVAVTAATFRGRYVSDPEYGVSFAVFFIAATAIVDGLALGGCFLGAAIIRRRVPSAADRAVLALAGALLLIGLLGVVLAPGVTPVALALPARP